MGESQPPGTDSSSTPYRLCSPQPATDPSCPVNWDVHRGQLSSGLSAFTWQPGAVSGAGSSFSGAITQLPKARLCVLGQVTQPPWTQPLPVSAGESPTVRS